MMNALMKHLPNFLTGLRLACAPALAVLLASGADRAALGVFAFAGLSDAADGFFAKRFGFVTRFGRYLDPAADKILMFAAFVALTAMGATPLWLAALVIGRDVAIIAGILAARMLNLPLRISPLSIGKWSTAAQVGYVGLALLFLAFDIHRLEIMRIAADVAGAFTVLSWLAYTSLWTKSFAARNRIAA